MNLREMLDMYEDMLAAAHKASDLEKQASCYNYIAATLRLMGKWNESYQCQSEGLKLARQIGSKLITSVALSNLGALCAEMGSFKEALDHLGESLDIARKLNNPLRIASALGTIGKVNLSRGLWDEAIADFEAALEQGKRDNSLRHQMCSYTSLGLAECSRGNYDPAEGYLKQALQFSSKIQRELSSETHISAKTLPDGSFSIEEHMKRRRDIFVLQLALARLQRCRDDLASAIQQLEDCLVMANQIGYKYGEIEATIEKSRCYQSLQDFSGARDLAEQAMTMAQELGSRRQEAYSLQQLAILLAILGDRPSAQEHFEMCTHIFEEVGDKYGSGLALLNQGMYLLRVPLERQVAANMLSGLQTIVSLEKVSESIDVIRDILVALRHARNALEMGMHELLNETAQSGPTSSTLVSEAEFRSSLETVLTLHGKFLDLLTIARILQSCGSLYTRLCPKDGPAKAEAISCTESISYLSDALRNVDETFINQASVLRNKINEFEEARHAEQSVLLQMLQTALTGLGATGIYLAILLKEVPKFQSLHLLILFLALLSWGTLPICIYHVRLKMGSLRVRIAITTLVAAGLIASLVLLMKEVL